MWDLSYPTGDGTHTPCIGRRSLNHCTTGKSPRLFLLSLPSHQLPTRPHSTPQKLALPQSTASCQLERLFLAGEPRRHGSRARAGDPGPGFPCPGPAELGQGRAVPAPHHLPPPTPQTAWEAPRPKLRAGGTPQITFSVRFLLLGAELEPKEVPAHLKA